MSNEYYEQAQKFLEITGTKLSCDFDAGEEMKQSEVWGDKTSKLLTTRLKVTLSNKNGRISFPFHTSHNDTYNQLIGSSKFKDGFAYNVLSSLDALVSESFESFCRDCGYDDDSISALKTYKKCVALDKKLRKIFTSEQLEMLAEIN